MNDSIFFYALLTATFLFAGMVKGVTGMGLPTVAMGLLGMVMPPSIAASILLVPSFVTNVWQLFSGGAIGGLVRRLWPMLVVIVLGTVGGSTLLVRIDPTWSGFALGSALIVYALYALFAPALSIPRSLEKWLSPVVGLITGVVTGATGVFVMPAVPYLGALGLEKDELVQALGLSFTVSTIALALGLLANGAFRLNQLGLSSLSVLPALLGMWLGSLIRAHISPKRFRQCFLIFLVVLGVELASRPFL
ncbi:sulfite exporter TauE/SafE family protein [Comamonas piscis]|uniref:Probable membrane transporter protein n=1 Tax=Comamonas piscis TaxID=1562974 RepID=A0A7G5EH68_9BURK|nr:sulfite exporter TauE/SafE family protein [Comamonas piscis]QMV73343.1 sulfite exporter TauE/SafE family protein [Comamonas piscis]WSO36145.1 sulfite exporter TauE/SafE family protein [Comamonas piscis]